MVTLYTREHEATRRTGARISVYCPALGLRRFYAYDYAAIDAHDAAIRAWCADPIVRASMYRADNEPMPARTFVRGMDRGPDRYNGWVYLELGANVTLTVSAR